MTPANGRNPSRCRWLIPARHVFNSQDLETGNESMGFSGGIGPGEGAWRSKLQSSLDLEALDKSGRRTVS